MTTSSSISAKSQTAYDDVPYPAAAFPQTHPNRLGALASLFRLNAVAPSKARVLELGCADGSNVLPMAQQLPGASFLGIDYSSKQIEAGQKALEAAGLKNVQLRQQDILEFPLTEGKFDYIIVHGVFSWVPEPVREKILAICSACLTDRGIAFISYNALPGWNMRKSLRDMMLFHTAGIAEPAARVRQARALLKFLADSVPSDGSAYGMMLKSELETISKVSDNYLFHDHMEKENTAFYFHEFMARARPHGLQYLGEAQLAAMNPANFSEGVRPTLNKIGDITVQEQYMDFLRNRLFRQTLLCRSSQSLQRNISGEQLKELSFHASFSVANKEVDWTPGVASTFRGPTGQQLTTENPLLKAAVLALIENRSRAMSFQELLDAARAKVPSSVPPAPDGAAVREGATLAASLLNMSVKGMVDLFAEPVGAGAVLGARPKTAPLTRYQAQRGTTVTNRLHHSLPLDAFGRAVLLVCDGERTQDQIVDHVVAETKAQRLQVQVGGKAVTDTRRLQGLLRPRVEALLALLARNGLLIA